ncbi:Apoptosis-stimulating of p53 protein 1 [Trachymyrmex septentrionalis]|uniref:Apoptosis-stimulating of p53 protein 1 n=1 Tax=Trachymyrmex septentrionalis TaxID=34720 RepID=A0A195FFQ5_9HYME|nr:Apoptosis-stimulating of p53 protein 1 [Trachymyrmex septentrionalis]
MLACVYPRENFEVKTVAVKLHHGKSKRKSKSVPAKEKLPSNATETECNNGEQVSSELAVGGGGAVLVLSELESMAARQQREIAQQRRLLEQKEARLAVLRGAQEPAQQDRLARLRHKLDQQQSKLNRLRLLRSQTDQSRVNNATLTSDLDCIRALFNEKEKELSLAVAKVEELTRQLEELRGRQNAPAGGGSAGSIGGSLTGATGNGHLVTPASAELEKLRRELMYRNKMNEQQNQVVSQQRQALAQRQAEMASIDARIAQLQSRLQRKRALNQRLTQVGPNGSGVNNTGFPDTKLDGFNNSGKLRPAGNIAAIEPYSHIPNDNDFNLNKNDPKYQTLPYNTKFTMNFKAIEDDVNKNKIQHSASASQLGQRPTFQQYGHQIVHSQSQSHIQGQSQLLGSNQQQQQHNQNLGNQPTTIQSSCNYNNNNNNNNNNNSNNLICNTAHNFSPDNLSQGLRLHQGHQHQQQSQTQQQQQHQNSNLQQKQHNVTSISGASTTSNLVGVTVPSIIQTTQNQHRNLQQTVGGHQKPVSSVAPSFSVKSQIYQTSSTKIHPVMPQTLSLLGRGHNNAAQNYIGNNQQLATANTQLQSSAGNQETNYRHGYPVAQQQQQQQQQQQYQNQTNIHGSSPAAVYQIQSSSNLVGLHGTTTTFGNSSQKYNQSSQVLSPNDLGQSQDQILNNQKTKFESSKSQDKFEHALPSNNKHEQQQQQHEGRLSNKYDHNPTFKHESSSASQYKSEYKSEPSKYESSGQSKFEMVSAKYEPNSTTKHAVDHVAAKFEIPAKTPDRPFEFDKPATKSSDSERKNFNEPRIEDKTKPALPPKPSKPNPPPRLTHHEKIDVSSSEGINECKMTNTNLNSRSDKDEEIPPIPTSEPPESPTETQLANHQIIKARPLTLKKVPISEQPKLRYAKSNVHVCKITNEDNIGDDGSKISEVMRRKKGNLKSTSTGGSSGKVNLSRRVSFDPLALLLDASLEGELELVKKTAKEVANPSSANDEGITALHNAICAGHLEIVKFLVEFGCDVNAQDSDGWTPLHCAASCNNLSMVRFLVEHGACIFATTLSDHETAAEKCEEDEEGFDGCSEYLYSVQEKLGIMNNGQVYAVFDYEAQHADELSLKNGDSVIVLRKGDDNEREWWWSKLGHKEGYVPRNLLGFSYGTATKQLSMIDAHRLSTTVMHKFRKLSQLKKKRERTLNVRLPHVIKDKKEVEQLFEGNFHIKLPRQSSKSCHIIFPTVEEKIKNYKLAKGKTIDGKRIVIQPLREIVFKKEINTRKKVFIPEIKPDIEVTKTLFISNVTSGTKSHEIRGALPGCVGVTLLKSYNKDFRSAMVKMENIQIAAEYLTEKHKWPVLNGHKICMKRDTRAKHKRGRPTSILKIHNENTIEKCNSSKSLNCTEVNNDSN